MNIYEYLWMKDIPFFFRLPQFITGDFFQAYLGRRSGRRVPSI